MRYQKHLISKHLYDYDDMILLVLEALGDRVEIKQYLQEASGLEIGRAHV